MDTIDALLDHKYLLLFILTLNSKAVPQKEVVSLTIEEPFGLVLLVSNNRVLRANFVLYGEDVDLRVPVSMGLGNCSEDSRYILPDSYE